MFNVKYSMKEIWKQELDTIAVLPDDEEINLWFNCGIVRFSLEISSDKIIATSHIRSTQWSLQTFNEYAYDEACEWCDKQRIEIASQILETGRDIDGKNVDMSLF